MSDLRRFAIPLAMFAEVATTTLERLGAVGHGDVTVLLDGPRALVFTSDGSKAVDLLDGQHIALRAAFKFFHGWISGRDECCSAEDFFRAILDRDPRDPRPFSPFDWACGPDFEAALASLAGEVN